MYDRKRVCNLVDNNTDNKLSYVFSIFGEYKMKNFLINNWSIILLGLSLCYNGFSEWLAHNPNIQPNSPLMLVKYILQSLLGKKDK